ncbi:MAG: hypothetical protein D6683_01885 [Actinomyces sp.]|nr:MAG: hypothetical protein D6683_01885 [Actinomyces sp.]
MTGVAFARGRASARAAVAGNPSDLDAGAVTAVPVRAFGAVVEVRRAERVSVDDPVGSWPATPVGLLDHVRRHGPMGARPLLLAALAVFVERLAPDFDEPVRLRWTTDIPRSVGLAGSSALVIAALRALCDLAGVEAAPGPLAAAALAAERDLVGIPAGPQDRVVQAHDAAVLMEFADPGPDGVGTARRLSHTGDGDLVVAWQPGAARPSGRVHREPALSRDPGLIDALAATARAAAACLESGDGPGLSAAMGESFALRRRLVHVDAGTVELVERAATLGLGANSAGSGGSILVWCPPERRAGLEEAIAAVGGRCRGVGERGGPGESMGDEPARLAP